MHYEDFYVRLVPKKIRIKIYVTFFIILELEIFGCIIPNIEGNKTKGKQMEMH